ncbi:4-oxalocrotonate tautomerase family protein [Streptomyces sp. NPDC014733]|uniref:tautomerase family protein n=1 Tax=Streptomyces sp. NPDC014733 TaxID=3364885 RepID=UPI0036F56F7F
MPYFRVTVTDPALPAEGQRALAEGLTALAVSVLRKDAARTLVHLDLVPSGRWFVAGAPLTDARDAYVEGNLTRGTNTAEERAAFVAAADALLTDVLGPLARRGVALHELDPDGYGYGGVTQRAHYGRPDRAPATA